MSQPDTLLPCPTATHLLDLFERVERRSREAKDLTLTPNQAGLIAAARARLAGQAGKRFSELQLVTLVGLFATKLAHTEPNDDC